MDDMPRFLRRQDDAPEDANDPSWWFASWVVAVGACLGLLYMARVSCIDAMPWERERCIVAAEEMANGSQGDRMAVFIRELGIAP